MRSKTLIRLQRKGQIIVIGAAAVYLVGGIKSIESNADDIRIQMTPINHIVLTAPTNSVTEKYIHTELEVASKNVMAEISKASKEPNPYDNDKENLYLLAKIAMAEAESEDTEGKALVMLVVLNRMQDDSFPDNIEEVLLQEGQFSPVGNGRYDKVEPNEDCWKALDLIRNDGWDESEGALYFESASASKWHSNNLEYLFKHGKHYFYKDKE